MPFTLSHPAAVLPLAGRGLVFSALVVGSMSPDFEYFLGVPAERRFAHTQPGIVLFCVPSGLSALWLFHTLLKEPLLCLLPEAQRHRLLPLAGQFAWLPWRRFLVVTISLAIGALTHVVWDSFTHTHGWAVVNFPVLQSVLLQTGQGELRLYKVLQHGSTLAGAGLLAVCGWLWLRKAPPLGRERVVWTPRFRAGMAAALLGIAVVCALANAVRTSPPVTDFAAFRHFTGRTVVSGMTVAFVEAVVFALWWHWRYRRSRRP
jgi:hypothetical protein